MLNTPKKIVLGSKDLLSISFIALAVCFGMLTLITSKFASSCSVLAKAEKPTLVQKTDGEAFIANPMPANYRDPDVVRRYVQTWIDRTFTLTASNELQDVKQGISYAGRTIPPNLLSVSYALPANKRREFIKAYVDEGWIPENYFTGNSSQEVELEQLSQAELIDNPKQIYTVNVIATISRYLDGKPTGEVEFYRRKITVAPIPIPQTEPKGRATFSQRLSYLFRKDGLQIISITPLSLE